jgi:hypothetical protein
VSALVSAHVKHDSKGNWKILPFFKAKEIKRKPHSKLSDAWGFAFKSSVVIASNSNIEIKGCKGNGIDKEI